MADRYRLKFTKLESIRFIGHLDLLKLFQRAMKRADVPIAYSQGFNPHQIMSFALPLPLGMASTGEYVDIALNCAADEADIIGRLNASMPKGIEILKCRALASTETGAAASVCAAQYDVTFPEPVPRHYEDDIRQAQEIVLYKRSKKQRKAVDIRPDIFSLSLDNEKPNVIHMLLATGSKQNLKPSLLVEHLHDVMEKPYNPYTIAYCRTEMYKGADEGFRALFD